MKKKKKKKKKGMETRDLYGDVWISMILYRFVWIAIGLYGY